MRTQAINEAGVMEMEALKGIRQVYFEGDM
jgi:hypothetical protein